MAMQMAPGAGGLPEFGAAPASLALSMAARTGDAAGSAVDAFLALLGSPGVDAQPSSGTRVAAGAGAVVAQASWPLDAVAAADDDGEAPQAVSVAPVGVLPLAALWQMWPQAVESLGAVASGVPMAPAAGEPAPIPSVPFLEMGTPAPEVGTPVVPPGLDAVRVPAPVPAPLAAPVPAAIAAPVTRPGPEAAPAPAKGGDHVTVAPAPLPGTSEPMVPPASEPAADGLTPAPSLRSVFKPDLRAAGAVEAPVGIPVIDLATPMATARVRAAFGPPAGDLPREVVPWRDRRGGALAVEPPPIAAVLPRALDLGMNAATLAPAAAAPPARTPINGEDLMEQVVQAIRWHWTGVSGAMQVRLQPEYLGAVSIDLRVEGGEVRAAVTADTPAVRQWIESHASELRAALSGQSLVLSELLVRDHDQPKERRHPPPRPASRRPPRSETPAIFDVMA